MDPAGTAQPRDATVRGRLRRIEGQAAGLRRMWDEARPAEELLDQVAALRAALNGAAAAIVLAETATRLRAPAADPERPRDDVLALVGRLVRSR